MITNSRIGWGDQLGAQLSTLANLTYIAKENKQQLVLWKELCNYRRGYQFLDVFDIKDIMCINRTKKIKNMIVSNYCSPYKKINSWQKQMNRIYNSKLYKYLDRFIYELIRQSYRDFEPITEKMLRGGVHTKQELLSLQQDKNYDISGGFGTYQDWKKYEDFITDRLKFKPEITSVAKKIYSEIKSKNSYKVSIHFRRTDYLMMSSLCLSDAYYVDAMEQFNSKITTFLIFSDDIEEIKNLKIFKNKDVIFMSGQTAAVDMCLMSMCNGNIIANSTFSFWGAMLNRNDDKKVVCPHDFIGSSSPELCYMNGNWYPDHWTAIKSK